MKMWMAGLVIFALAGCETLQSDDATPSGFLGDYSKFQKGGDDEALLVYKKPGADLSKYNAVFVKPVKVWVNADAKDVDPKEMQRLADFLHATVVDRLQKDFRIAPAPGQGVLEVTSAITEAEGSSVALDMISAVVPIGRAIEEIKHLATGSYSFVGRAGVEASVNDSVTGERLFAAVDRRAGRKSIAGSAGTWNDVEAAYEYWANRLATRLAEEGLRTNH